MAEWPRSHRSSAPVPALSGALGSVPVRRGVAAVVVSGGALSLMGAAAPSLPAVGASTAEATTRVALQGPQEVGPAPVDAVLLRSAVEPVRPEPTVLDDASYLVKAVQLVEQEVQRVEAERVAAEQAAAAEAAAEAARVQAEQERRASVGADCGLNTSGLGAVKDYVREAAEFLGCLFGEPAMHGVAGRAGTSDHPTGKAIDFMVDRATGDQLADCALRNRDALGISYVIWEQRINYGSGWEPMEDRGGATANHFDHVHVSFDNAGGGELTGC